MDGCYTNNQTVGVSYVESTILNMRNGLHRQYKSLVQTCTTPVVPMVFFVFTNGLNCHQGTCIDGFNHLLSGILLVVRRSENHLLVVYTVNNKWFWKRHAKKRTSSNSSYYPWIKGFHQQYINEQRTILTLMRENKEQFWLQVILTSSWEASGC